MLLIIIGKLNPSLYSEVPFNSYISSKIVVFFHINHNGAVSRSTLWESFKVIICGYIISYQSSCKRARLKRLTDIKAKLLELEESYWITGSEDTLSSILKIKYEYNHILGEQVGNYIRKLKQKHFELSDKADKLLAKQLKGVQADRASLHPLDSYLHTTNRLTIDFLVFTVSYMHLNLLLPIQILQNFSIR